MSEDRQTKPSSGRGDFGHQGGLKAPRKPKAQRQVTRTMWFDLGMIGLVGWSVAVPVLVGAGLAMWLDANHPVGHSWMLMLMPVGLVLGCFNAWRWVSREGRGIREQEEESDD